MADGFEYPGIFLAADESAIRAQKRYYWLIKLDLALMVLGALIASFSYQTLCISVIIYIILGCLLVGSLLITIFLYVFKFDEKWIQSRIFAESAKSLTWQFVCGGENFVLRLDTSDEEEILAKSFKDLSQKFPELSEFLDAQLLSQSNITDSMREIRRLGVNERKKYYVEFRINDQKKWYSKKSKLNSRGYYKYFALLLFCQFCSVVYTYILAAYPSVNVNLIGLFTTLSITFFSWLKFRQFQENKIGYTRAVQDLTFISDSSNKVETDEQLAKFISDTENAISREHKVWYIQKKR